MWYRLPQIANELPPARCSLRKRQIKRIYFDSNDILPGMYVLPDIVRRKEPVLGSSGVQIVASRIRGTLADEIAIDICPE
jgi:hypothetical protein